MRNLRAEDINVDELPEIYQTLAAIVGVEDMLKIAEVFGGGESVYFPAFAAIRRTVRNREIIAEFNGYNCKALAKKYGLTEMGIRAILKEEIERRSNEPIPGQIKFED